MGSDHDWQALCEAQIMPSGEVAERIEWCATPGCCASRYLYNKTLPAALHAQTYALERMYDTLVDQLRRAHLLVVAGVVPVTRQ